MALAIAGCTTVPVATLPPLPGKLAADCVDPGVRVGKTVLGEFAVNRQALAQCRQKHHDTVKLYNDLRSLT